MGNIMKKIYTKMTAVVVALVFVSSLSADCRNVTVTDEDGIVHLVLVCD